MAVLRNPVCFLPLRHGHVKVSKLSESARDGPTRIFGKYRHLELDVVSDHTELRNRKSDLRGQKIEEFIHYGNWQ